MYGTVIGDVVGSRFEWRNYRNKDFIFFHPDCKFTDDTVLSLAIGQALLRSRPDWSDLGEQAIQAMREGYQAYPKLCYGGGFLRWVRSNRPQPYHSYGNGAAMRVGACGYAGATLEETQALARMVTEITHDHPEGMKGAQAVASVVWLARTGSTIPELRDYVNINWYPIDFTLAEIRPDYRFNTSCQGTVPQAIAAFLESESFEDAIRNAVSIGGDSDTVAAMTGAMAEAYYGVPRTLREQASQRLKPELIRMISDFEAKYPPKILEG